jgi:hypothetical protein
MTVAQMFGFTLDNTSGGGIAATVPTGAVIAAATGSALVAGDCWTFTYANRGNQTVTITAASGVTFATGSTMTIATLKVNTFFMVATAASTFVIYDMTGSGTY